jgi:biofilm PGA synthesis protein PgaA
MTPFARASSPAARRNPRLRRRGLGFCARLLLAAAPAAAAAAPGGEAALAPDPPRPAVSAERNAEHDKAVALARAGDTAAALATLDRLYRERPDDLGIARDVVLISNWAGRDEQAIRVFEALPPGPHPDYVLEAAARSYRGLGRWREAAALFGRGRQQSPGNPAFAAGEVRSLVDGGEAARARALADEVLRQRGERLEVLLAAGYAADALSGPIEALRYVDRALKLAPDSREARADRILAIERMGAPRVALRLLERQPDLLSPADRRRIEGSAAAALVRWDEIEPASDAERFAAADRSIAELDARIAQWSAEGGDAARRDIQRARLDRMVALHDRQRMREVIEEYEAFRRDGVEVPNYVLGPVADAYSYLGRPEAARDLFRQALTADPKNFGLRLGLFYAYSDLEEFDAALREADALVASQDPWIRLKGSAAPVPNLARVTADVAAANARLYADDLPGAERRFAALAEAAPRNVRFHAGLAHVYAARGWPRRAAEEYEIARALKQREDASVEAGQAANNLGLREYRTAEAQIADLTRRYPENREVQRLARDWQALNMAELRVSAERSLRPGGASAQGSGVGSGLALRAELYSPPIAYNWRAFAGETIAHERVSEGNITLRWTYGGVEYRGRDVVASLEAGAARYGAERGTARAAVTWTPGDHWEIGGALEKFTRDTPIRALKNGVTADAASLGAVYRVSEQRDFRWGATLVDFSDGNRRTALSGRYRERLLTLPRFRVDAVAGLYASHNTKDNVAYFSPANDGSFAPEIDLSHVLYRRDGIVYEHRLALSPGLYWQERFGARPVGALRYDHRFRSGDRVDAGVGVALGRQSYDGQYETSLALLFDATVRF